MHDYISAVLSFDAVKSQAPITIAACQAGQSVASNSPIFIGAD